MSVMSSPQLSRHEVGMDSFNAIMPVIFNQIVDGEEKKEYALKTGWIKVFISGEQKEKMCVKIHHGGSLNILSIAHKIHDFFQDVDLQIFFKREDQLEKKALSAVFSQIVNKEDERDHELQEGCKCKVKLVFEKYKYMGVFETKLVCHMIPLNPSNEESPSRNDMPNLTPLLNSLVSEKNLARYFWAS